jgi:hypothetical protein
MADPIYTERVKKQMSNVTKAFLNVDQFWGFCDRSDGVSKSYIVMTYCWVVFQKLNHLERALGFILFFIRRGLFFLDISAVEVSLTEVVVIVVCVFEHSTTSDVTHEEAKRRVDEESHG